MADTLKELGKGFGGSRRDVEFLKRRGGLLPAIDRTRGSMEVGSAFIVWFTIDQDTRRVGLKLSFHKLAL